MDAWLVRGAVQSYVVPLSSCRPRIPVTSSPPCNSPCHNCQAFYCGGAMIPRSLQALCIFLQTFANS